MICLISCSNSTTEQNNVSDGQIISLEEQNLNLVSIPNLGTISYSSPAASGFFTGYFGDYFGIESGIGKNYQIANIANTESLYNFDPVYNFQGNNPLVESVAAYTVEYISSDPSLKNNIHSADILSGLILVPHMKPGNKIKGVVLYFHPTTLKKAVPSCLGSPDYKNYPNISSNPPDYCFADSRLASRGARYFSYLSGIFASNGYIVLAPDYPGLGADYKHLHPYVVNPTINALSGLNMFSSLRQVIKNPPYNLDAEVKLPLFINGFSEGGGYALKASELLQTSSSELLTNNNLELKITVPVSGAYSLIDQMHYSLDDFNDGVFNCSLAPYFNCGNTDSMESSTSTTLNSDVVSMNKWQVGSAGVAAFIKPFLLAYMFSGAIYYDFNNKPAANDFMMDHRFWSFSYNNVPVTLYSLFSSELSEESIMTAITDNTMTINNYNYETTPIISWYYPNEQVSTLTMPLASYGLNNAGSNFLHRDAILSPPMLNYWNLYSTYNWHSNSPINFVYITYDSDVGILNTEQAYSCMKYGETFNGSNAPCNKASASNDFIESTIIPATQLTNNILQYYPLGFPGLSDPTTINPYANSKFWSQNKTDPQTGTPYDHPNIGIISSIIALCSFENIIDNHKISGVCDEKWLGAEH